MTDEPKLDVSLVRHFFKTLRYQDDRRIVEVDMRSKTNRAEYSMGLRVREPDFRGAYPQRRFALERHWKRGHKGVHLQAQYHMIDNDLNIGRLYIMLGVKDDPALKDLSEGFVFTLQEVLRAMGADHGAIADEMFNMPLVNKLEPKKGVLLSKIEEGIDDHLIEIWNIHNERIGAFVGKDIRRLVNSRRELVPLLGPMVEREDL